MDITIVENCELEEEASESKVSCEFVEGAVIESCEFVEEAAPMTSCEFVETEEKMTSDRRGFSAGWIAPIGGASKIFTNDDDDEEYY